MRVNFRCVVTVKIDVAKVVSAIAAAIYFLT